MAGQEAIAGYLGCDYPLNPSRGDPDADGKSPFMGVIPCRNDGYFMRVATSSTSPSFDHVGSTSK